MSELWFRFYPKSWRTDRALKQCTLPARLIWLEMMLVMREANPKGFFVGVSGEPIDIRSFASEINAKPSEVRKAILELTNRGVCSTDSFGRLFCRFIVREAAKTERLRENGLLGGNPLLLNQMTPVPVNQNGYPKTSQDLKHNIKEKRRKEESDSLRSSALGFRTWPDDVATLKGLALLFIARFANCRDPLKAEKHLGVYTGVLAQMRSRGVSIETAWRACEDALEANGDKPLFAGTIKTAISFLPLSPRHEASAAVGEMADFVAELRAQEGT